MSRAWISAQTFYSIMEQAAKNNGRAVLELTGGYKFNITVDPEFAKEEWDAWEEHLAKFKKESKE